MFGSNDFKYSKMPNYVPYDYEKRGKGFEDALDAQLKLEQAQGEKHTIKEMVGMRINAFVTKALFTIKTFQTFGSAAVQTARTIEQDVRCHEPNADKAEGLATKLKQLHSLGGKEKQEIEEALKGIGAVAEHAVATTSQARLPAAMVSRAQIGEAANRDVKEASNLLYQILRDDPISTLTEAFLGAYSGDKNSQITFKHFKETLLLSKSPLVKELRQIISKAENGKYKTVAEVNAATKRALELVNMMEAKSRKAQATMDQLPDMAFKKLGVSVVTMTKDTTYNVGDIGNKGGKYYERIVENPAHLEVGADNKVTAVAPTYGWTEISQDDVRTKISFLPKPGELISNNTKTTQIDRAVRNLETAQRLLTEFKDRGLPAILAGPKGATIALVTPVPPMPPVETAGYGFFSTSFPELALPSPPEINLKPTTQVNPAYAPARDAIDDAIQYMSESTQQMLAIAREWQTEPNPNTRNDGCALERELLKFQEGFGREAIATLTALQSAKEPLNQSHFMAAQELRGYFDQAAQTIMRHGRAVGTIGAENHDNELWADNIVPERAKLKEIQKKETAEALKQFRAQLPQVDDSQPAFRALMQEGDSGMAFRELLGLEALINRNQAAFSELKRAAQLATHFADAITKINDAEKARLDRLKQQRPPQPDSSLVPASSLKELAKSKNPSEILEIIHSLLIAGDTTRMSDIETHREFLRDNIEFNRKLIQTEIGRCALLLQLNPRAPEADKALLEECRDRFSFLSAEAALANLALIPEFGVFANKIDLNDIESTLGVVDGILNKVRPNVTKKSSLHTKISTEIDDNYEELIELFNRVEYLVNKQKVATLPPNFHICRKELEDIDHRVIAAQSFDATRGNLEQDL